jgi:ferrous iron transport protein B
VKFALLGNPNTGKSTVFNMLTGLRQHVGNFPGVTVDKKVGKIVVGDTTHELIDFPGTYSIYPRSKDEEVVYKSISNKADVNYPDAVIIVLDAANLERNLLLFSQIYDLQFPTLMVLNMTDLAKRKNIIYNLEELQLLFPEAKIVASNARVKFGKQDILDGLAELPQRTGDTFLHNSPIAEMDDLEAQEQETKFRFGKLRLAKPKFEQTTERITPKTRRIDNILVHPVFGYIIFAAILLIVFQFVYVFASIPMDFIDGTFSSTSAWMSAALPQGYASDLLTQGIIPGVGGVVIFIPQIALLFFFISVLEETGYLSRVVFIMDRLMRPFGLNGKSVVPLMSSVACAIPGVMSARTISDWKERMITIMVAPLMSCSARIPVYTLLIALVIPNTTIFGFINVQGLVLFGLYALGTFSALLIAIILKLIIKTKEKGFLMLEMPSYKFPKWQNVGLTVWEKVKIFVWDAGKIILAISIVLWGLATFGPSENMEKAGVLAQEKGIELGLSSNEINQNVAAAKLENSYIGILGKGIEPVIKPLGYDWKIGISLITSFAAREVFVGSMATIYAVGDDSETSRSLMDKMRTAKRADGTKVYTLATGVSLMIFYVFAMQCMATLAVVKRETKSWKWPLIQMGYMGVLAYLGAFVTYLILS